MYPTIAYMYREESIGTVFVDIHLGGISYYRYWRDDHHGIIKPSYLMGMIQCYALSYTGGGRFPWSLFPVIIDMIQHGIIYAWAPTLLAQIYKELFFYSHDHRYSLSMMITL